MALSFPYMYYACDCYDATTTTSTKRASQIPTPAEDEERNFDPLNPRSNYALYPLEHLLYCEDCRQIRCARCVTEETLNWYCPSCLFEVPSSVVKSDGNRCTRNCFNCPICISPLMVNLLENSENASSTIDRHILACPHCHWSTAEIGVEFEKPTGVYGQLSRKGNGGKPIPTQKEREKLRERQKELSSGESPTTSSGNDEKPSRDDLFYNLGAFYKTQIEAQAPSNPYSPHDFNFSSPSAYTRIMNLYSTKKQKRGKPTLMREAGFEFEGLAIQDSHSDVAAIERIKRDGWSSTLSTTQKLGQVNPYVHFEDDLRPVPTLLCTKRTKRCRSCRVILSKPESKIASSRYKIKLLAQNHIPRLSIRAFNPANPHVTSTALPAFNYSALRSGIPTHFLLHLSNPLFDPVRVTLATPSTTSGRVKSQVTIMCPQFEVGANMDAWDDALSSSVSPTTRGASVNADGQIEAGKIWDKGRNWTSVVIEVVPGFLKTVLSFGQDKKDDYDELDEDDSLLEIPIFVRLEFESDPHAEHMGDSRGSKGEKEKREEAFWTVLGVGRIAAM